MFVFAASCLPLGCVGWLVPLCPPVLCRKSRRQSRNVALLLSFKKTTKQNKTDVLHTALFTDVIVLLCSLVRGNRSFLSTTELLSQDRIKREKVPLWQGRGGRKKKKYFKATKIPTEDIG